MRQGELESGAMLVLQLLDVTTQYVSGHGEHAVKLYEIVGLCDQLQGIELDTTGHRLVGVIQSAAIQLQTMPPSADSTPSAAAHVGRPENALVNALLDLEIHLRGGAELQ